jgi:type IV secretion system protein VirD4
MHSDEGLLVRFLLFPAVLFVAMLVAKARQPKEARIDSTGAFAAAYLKKHWKSTLICLYFWFVDGSVAAVIALVVLRGLRMGIGATRSQFVDVRKQWHDRIADERKAWLASLGETPEDRTAAVNAMFDRKDKTLSITRWYEQDLLGNVPTKGPLTGLHVGCRISRNLAAIETREREFLRTVELLDVNSNGESAEWCSRMKFGLLWGNGKATIEEYHYSVPENQGVKDAHSAVGWYASRIGATVDSSINEILQNVEKLGGAAPQGGTLQPVMQSINARLKGGHAWLAQHELLETIFAKKNENSLVIGALDDGDAPLTYSGEGSMISIAPPRSGKTQCHVFPNLLRWRGPAVVLDVKGEIYAGTSKWRQENVGPVYKWAPLDPAHSHRYNPLSFVRQETDYIWEDSRLLADMMIVPSGASDPFWENKARDVLTAAIAHVCYGNGPAQRPMSQVIDIVHGGRAWDDMVLGLQTAIDVRAMVQQATALSTMPEKTRDSVLQAAQASLSAWSGERVSRATTTSDWSPLDLRSGSNPTIYICLKPSEVESYTSLLRVFIGQHIRMLCDELPPRGSTPILFLLDELPRLRQMPPVEEAIEIGASYGLRLWMFAQSMGQMEKAYPNAAGMIGSCAVRIFMNPTGADGLTEKLSEELGYRESALDGSRQRLVEAADLAGPGYREYQIVMGSGAKPAKVRKAYAWQDQQIASRMGSLET